MNYRDKETEKIAARIKEKVLIFPSWDSRGLDDKRAEYEAHKGEYTYPMNKIEPEIEQEKHDLPNDKLFTEANAHLKKLSENIREHAGQLVEQAFSKGLKSSEEITDRYINRIADEIMNKNPESCVITVPDKWFPT